MGICEVCGNEYDMAFEVVAAGARHVFEVSIKVHEAGVMHRLESGVKGHVLIRGSPGAARWR